jgi:hypothetical protein
VNTDYTQLIADLIKELTGEEILQMHMVDAHKVIYEAMIKLKNAQGGASNE